MLHSGQRVLVAGGTGALGRAVALEFLEAGATVVVSGRERAGYDALVKAAGNDRERLGVVLGEVSDPAAAVTLAGAVAERLGGIDALVNTVGAWAGGANLWETEPESYARMLGANLTAAFALARAVLPYMLRQGSGFVVGVGSRAASSPAPGAAAYAAAKAGMAALYAALAEEVRPHRINVNVVAPDVIDTEANRRAMPGADFTRWTKPEAIARVILFLCSEAGRAVHGAVVPVQRGG